LTAHQRSSCEAALARLGSTPGEVAATLRRGNYRGVCRGEHCPVARYLRDEGCERPNVGRTAVFAGPEWDRERVTLPGPVELFVRLFDEKAYPELILGGAS
jgi:hypothetical protein